MAAFIATCAHCGAEYEAHQSNATYCRNSCRALASQARRRSQWEDLIRQTSEQIQKLTDLLNKDPL